MIIERPVKSKQKRYSIWFIVVIAIFITSLITSNIISVKLIMLFGIVLPAGVIIFPISYVVGDILTEVYGYSHARRVIWLGFLCNLILMISIWFTGLLKPAPFWDGQSAYIKILGFTPRLLVASFTAYLFGEFVNAFVLARMKIATNGKWLWCRTISSTFFGQGLDSLLFITISFAGTIPIQNLLPIIVSQWFFKTAYEAALTPLTYLAVNFLKYKENLDTYDYYTSFNPLKLSE